MRGGSIRVFLLASLVVHGTAISLMPRDPRWTDVSARHVGRAPGSVAAVDVTPIPSWRADPDGRIRALVAWADALAVARSPIEIDPPGAASRTDAALDLGAPGSGAGRPAESETRLTDRDDGVAMSENLPNSLAQSQVQRLETGTLRSTWDDRRATPSPADDDLVASPTDPGDARTRRRSPADPALGDPGSTDRPQGAPPLQPTTGQAGTDGEDGSDTPARAAIAAVELPAGVADPSLFGRPDGVAAGPARSEPVPQHQRPDVAQGAASVPAPVHDTRTRDTRDGRFWNAHFYRSYTDAARVSGEAATGSGDGRRGEGRGLTGSGTGAVARAADARGPTWISFHTGDPRYLSYFRQIHRKIDPLWRQAFPETLQLSHDQGTVIVGFVLHRNGSVSGVRVLRGSGYPLFDANVLAAVERAAPFGPIPSEISDDVLRVSAPFHFSNPMF